ncbi:hypothetical protein D9756_000786 [Leucocoprinus leucothites]|uniref:Uncharacterized protein n=1 Tax=Leucocoprinus leucothites TaxID=201217 RepID=A0A8H5GFG5_9AGAR|nr:hypothetical protein D9756_000786 [Leucoagaricus leucothites]
MVLLRVRYLPSSILKKTFGIRSPRLLSVSTTQTDECGIPLTSTWSVTELLSSYPKPSISSQTLNRLHDLAALIPPVEGTSAHAKLREEISELVRLVEAVKLVDTKGVSVSARWDQEDADKWSVESLPKEIPEGQELLKHAARTENGFYLVDADRKKKLS